MKTNALLNEQQRAKVGKVGFSSIVEMELDALEARGMLAWNMDHTDPDTFTIKAGPGKELKFTKEVVRLVLGLPSSGCTPASLSYTDASFALLISEER